MVSELRNELCWGIYEQNNITNIVSVDDLTAEWMSDQY